ncbi:MAG: sodium-dependent transporter [Bacteroidales bacterium]|nr:sodium-dependent transporter [Bacteroidales bacterium]
MAQSKDGWGSRIGLILAMAGNAVGLGNFLRFPVQAVQNGGGAFIIPYFVSFLVMGIPLLWIEWAMGRYGGIKGNHSTPFITDSMGKKRIWKYVGVFGIFTNLGIISYYTYIESWTLSYTLKSIGQSFTGLSRAQVSTAFDNYVGVHGTLSDRIVDINIPHWAIVIFLITLAINIYILSKGLSGGIEKVAKIGMPLLILFGIFLAIRGITLGHTGVAGCTTCNSQVGLDFLWKPDFTSLANPKVWLAAAGQIFFTLSVGMGTIQCYAAYLKKNDDIALNAMTAGWMNEFVEIVLGAAIVIPIAVGYMGLDWVKQNAGFMMAFKTMPYLFNQWGPLLATLSGVAWFGLLFFAGITSSLAMGTPFMGFMEDEFGWKRGKSSIVLGIIVLILALPTIFFFEYGVFNEYDYWTGTVSLVVFATLEVILFSWVFGMKNGWEEITRGSDIKVPTIYKFIIKWITPIFIIVIFITSLIEPVHTDMAGWQSAFHQLFTNGTWPWANDSIIAQIFHLNEKIVYFKNGVPTGMFFKDMARLLLISTFLGLSYLVHIASNKRKLANKTIES